MFPRCTSLRAETQRQLNQAHLAIAKKKKFKVEKAKDANKCRRSPLRSKNFARTFSPGR